MLGDDDRCEPDRIARQVAVFDRHPDTGVVHGDATIIDAAGVARGTWPSRDRSPHELLRHLVREHNTLVDPSRMVHRRVYEAVGGYDPAFRLAQDFDFWLRAVRRFRFRDVPGGPLIGFRRHGENFSDESARDLEVQEVERALRTLIDAAPLRELVPELDWGVMHPRAAERRALEVLADAFDHRAAARSPGWRASCAPAPPACPRRRARRRQRAQDRPDLLRLQRLRRRHHRAARWRPRSWPAAAGTSPSSTPPPGPTRPGSPTTCANGWRTASGSSASTTASTGSGTSATRCASSTTRRSRRPSRALLDRVQPDVVHFHNLHNLGAALIDEAAARGLPSYFSTHNYWLICPRAYLLTGEGAICAGPGERGANCASCVGSPHDRPGHQERLAGIRDRFTRGVSVCLAVSDAMRATLLGQATRAR